MKRSAACSNVDPAECYNNTESLAVRELSLSDNRAVSENLETVAFRRVLGTLRRIPHQLCTTPDGGSREETFRWEQGLGDVYRRRL